MELPKLISPCPIIDALFELRFSSNTHSDAVFGLLYNVLKDDFPKVESLPILQLPETIRQSDVNLKGKPHYKILGDDFIVQIGPNVITISSFPNYIGWDSFSQKIFSVIEKVEKVGCIETISRIGIRYINFFEDCVFQDVKLKILIGKDEIKYNNTVLRTEFSQKEFNSTLQIANNARNASGKSGSIIDIDTFRTKDLENFFNKKEEIITNGHRKEKELFFSLLSNEFLGSLNPKY